MKKICFITTIHNTLKGFILKYAEYMHESGDYDITFVCHPDEAFAKSLPEYIHYEPIPMTRGISLDGIKACARMIRLFRKNKYDMIQYSTPNASLYASLAGFMARIPVRLYCQWGLVFESFSGFKRWVFKQEEKLVCRLSTWIEPDSRGNLDLCRKERIYTPEKSSVIGNGSACGIDLIKFDISKRDNYRRELRKEWNVDEKTVVYGFVGSITGDKGINELLGATKELCEHDYDVRLAIVGKSEKEYSLNPKLIDWSRNDSHVIYCGLTSCVEKYLSAMDCYVIPSYREGFGMTVIEAGAMGLPVITSNIPGPTDAIKDGFNGLVVEKKSVESLLKAMKTMHDHPEQRKQFGDAGLKNVREKYDQKVLFKAILEDRKLLLGE